MKTIRRKNSMPALRIALVCAAALALAAAIAAALIPSTCGRRPAGMEGEELAALVDSADYPDAGAETAVRSAVSLVGRVRYFWGGKSFMLGEDPGWGVPKTVISEGSRTTGSVRPFGLDCSGLVTWAYVQAGMTVEEIGNGTWNQWMASEQIGREELRPGDLGFQREYPGNSGNHVGIFIGYHDGSPMFVHCSPTFDGVVVTSGEGIFNYFRRPRSAGEGSFSEDGQ